MTVENNRTTKDAVPPRRGISSLIEWFTCSSALAAAKAEEPNVAERRRWLARARDAVRAGDQKLDPPDGSRQNPELALRLFQIAGSLLLKAIRLQVTMDESFSTTFEAVSDVAVREFPKAANPPAAMSARPDTFAELVWDSQIEGARAAQEWVYRLLEDLDSRYGRYERLKFRRAARLGVVIVIVCAFIAFVLVASRPSSSKHTSRCPDGFSLAHGRA